MEEQRTSIERARNNTPLPGKHHHEERVGTRGGHGVHPPSPVSLSLGGLVHKGERLRARKVSSVCVCLRICLLPICLYSSPSVCLSVCLPLSLSLAPSLLSLSSLSVPPPKTCFFPLQRFPVPHNEYECVVVGKQGLVGLRDHPDGGDRFTYRMEHLLRALRGGQGEDVMGDR